MKKVYLAIHILIEGKKNTMTMTLDVTDETYELLTKLAEDDVVDNREIYDNYEVLSAYVEEPVNAFSKELGMTVDDELYCSLQIRLDCPWDVALERYLKELEERLANGDVQALLDKGYYLKYECDDFDGAMELYREAMRRDAQNATDYLFDDDSVFGVGDDVKAEIIKYAYDRFCKNLISEDMHIRKIVEFEETVPEECRMLTPVLIDRARGNDLSALTALGCIDMEGFCDSIQDVVRYGELKMRFLCTFFVNYNDKGLKMLEQYFRYGIYVDKDEHMAELIELAIERIRKKTEEGTDWLQSKAAEMLSGEEGDILHFLRWLKKLLKEGGEHRATALSIISYLMDQNIDAVLHDVLAAISERYK